MQDDTKNNADASDTTSPAGPPRDKLSEAEYLAREAGHAKRAIAHTLDDMRASLKQAGDVRAWARTYPWTTLGAAAATGFLVAAALAPKRGRGDKEDAALQERILTDEQIAARLRELAAEDGKKGEGPMHTIIASLVKTLGPAVQAAVTSAMMARPAPDDESPNGHAADSAEADDRTQPPPPPSE
jgi:hypothetical protein